MKNKRRNIETLDQIIFKDRNKNYGAFYLRIIYKKTMTKALIISITIFLLMISIPLIGNYMANKTRIIKPEQEIIKITTYDRNKKADPVIPKIKQPDVKEIIRKINFIPKVVKPEDADTTEFLTDDINDKNKNRPIDTLFTDIVIKDNDKEKVIEIKKDSVYIFVEEKPSYPGGEAALLQFLSSKVHYPQIAVTYLIQGIVHVAFVVEKDGSISNVRAVTKIGAGCEEEAVRVVNLTKTWLPGRQNGQPVRVEVVLPVIFRLSN